jgi:hypothetical protein
MSDERCQEHLKKMYKHEAIFWSTSEDDDAIAQQVRTAIGKMELITKSVMPDSMTPL